MKFNDLEIGDKFDFVDEQNPRRTSFSALCVKVSAKKYMPLEGALKDDYIKVGKLDCEVFHVNMRE